MSFFGGEPFLCYKGVKELLDYSKAFCENNDIELIADFTTNATLVSSKRIEYLKQFRCHFQITLDGWKENHNRIKVNNGAKIDAYSKTVEALRLINENIENRWIAVRINFDNNTLEYIDKIIDDINFLDRSKTYVILKKVWQMDTDKVNKKLLIEAIQKLFDNKFYILYKK